MFLKFFCVVAATFLAGTVSGGYLDCWTASDCVAENANCVNSLCECPEKHVFNEDGSACLEVAIGIEADCTDDNQCGYLLGKNRCNRGKCDCDEGWHYYRGRCMKSVGLNNLCNTDEECFNGYDLFAMRCEKKCVCNEGYYLRGDYDCRPEATELGDYCSIDLDCKIPDSVCSNSKCTKRGARIEPPSPTFTNETTTKTLQTSIKCRTNSDCLSMKNAICYGLTKQCICKRGYFLSTKTDTCVPELGMDVACENDADCPVTPGRCVNGKCLCRKTYFTSKGNNACQKPMTKDHLFCNTNDRCYVLGMEGVCQNNECRCSVKAELDEYSICRPNTGTCASNACDYDDECYGKIPNSVCLDSECQCPADHRFDKDYCWPNIGATCDDQLKICNIENARCSDGTCKCNDLWVQNGTTLCVAVASGIDGECGIDVQCSSTVPNSVCKENKCQCMDGYVLRNGSCLFARYMEDTCANQAQCHVVLGQEVRCRNNKCQCSVGWKITEDQKNCKKSNSVAVRVYSILVLLSLAIVVF